MKVKCHCQPKTLNRGSTHPEGVHLLIIAGKFPAAHRERPRSQMLVLANDKVRERQVEVSEEYW